MELIERKEWGWAIGWSFGLSLLVTLPYFYGILISDPIHYFSGFIIGLEDGHSYLAKMQQGRSGYWLFRLVYTPEPHQGALFFIYYILLGKLAGLSGFSNLIIFHLSKFFTIPFALLAFYRFTAYFTPTIKIRKVAFLIFGFSGGLGWLWLASGGTAELGHMPVDLWAPDASFFLAALTYAHLPLSQGLFLLLTVSSVEFLKNGQKKYGFQAAGYGLLVSLVHPYRLPILGLLLGLYALWQFYKQPRSLQSRLLRLLIIVGPATPYLIYVLSVFYNNPAFAAWREQSLTFSPAPIHYLLGFGATLLLALVGFRVAPRYAGQSPYNFLRLWLVVVPLLLYVPLGLQRRFLDGYQAPLALLAAIGVIWLFESLGKRLPFVATTLLLLIVMSLTNILLTGLAIMAVTQRSEQIFIAGSQIQAAAWLAQHSKDEVILSSYQSGNFLPTRANVRTFAGHGPETINSEAKQEQIVRFFDRKVPEAWRVELLKQFNIAYIYYGPAEQTLGDFVPAKAPYLEKIYDAGDIQIFEVVLAGDEG